MSWLRKTLVPFSVVYGEITAIRNRLYDRGILKSTRFDLPIIVVGNLSVGGTGKTPQVEYLVRLLKNHYSVAILSRGYKRETSGFIIANNKSTAKEIGDEPLQYFKKFKGVTVAVDADRVHGISQLKALTHPPEVILLDDAFQHRKVDAGLTILLTPFNDLYADDLVLPAGNLREKIKGANRAQIIVVTKGPEQLSKKTQSDIATKLKINVNQRLFFSTIRYEDEIKGQRSLAVERLENYKVILVTGIAKTEPLESFLHAQHIRFKHFKYKDHHNFSTADLTQIQAAYDQISDEKKLILTTEKDYVRSFAQWEHCYYLPIKTSFIDHAEEFDHQILSYIAAFDA